MTDKEIKSRLTNWDAKTTTERISDDPIRYQAEVSFTMYGVEYRGGGFGETRSEAVKEARQSIANQAF